MGVCCRFLRVFRGLLVLCAIGSVWWLGYWFLFRGPPSPSAVRVSLAWPSPPSGLPLVVWRSGLCPRRVSSLGPCVARVGGLVMLDFVAVPAPAAVVSSSLRAGFVPSAARVGAAVVPSSAFLLAGRGVVTSFGWDAERSAVWVALSGGPRLLCLCSAIGGVGSPGAVALATAVRSAFASGREVSLVGAPGRSGLVCRGYFCGVWPGLWPR